MTEGVHMGMHLRVLSESYQMNTNMTGFSLFVNGLKMIVAIALEELKANLPMKCLVRIT